MSDKKRPIGLLDSGVGGLTVASEIVNYLPAEEIAYYGDTLHLPYGPRLLEEVREFVFVIVDYLLSEKNAKAIILACNTATSAALKAVKEKYSVPVFGTIDSVTKRAIKESHNYKIGVIGTEGTVNSQAYQKSLLALDRKLKVFSAACPEFVRLVEEGRFAGPKVEKVARKYLVGLKEAGVDVLILGCTHYPYLVPVIQKVMGKEVTLISSGEAMAREVKNILKGNNMLIEDKGEEEIKQQEFIVSDQE
ncbi:MAG: glutamate racemase, partial [Halanaerobiales bacterium]|nr:glutamate racemase [Halanaerobiales bacterium]